MTQISETTPVQMITEQQLELNQQLSLDIINYWGRGWIIHKHKTSSFLAVYEAASFQRIMICSLDSCFIPHPGVHHPCTVCGHAISNGIGLKEFIFFNQTSHACNVWGRGPKGLQQRVPLDRVSVRMHAQ